jgi:hypothetical protein
MNASDVSLWSGYRGHSQDADEISEVTATLDVGSRGNPAPALVIGDEPLRTTYVPELHSLVQWLYADAEDELLQFVHEEAGGANWESGADVNFEGNVVLFDSAIPGDELAGEEFLEIRMDSGVYRIMTADIESERTGARVHRFVRES